ncbi:hypothetical protein L9F63_026825, partial [Diploptera punctata]
HPVVFEGVGPQPEKLAKINEPLQFLDKFLEDRDFVAGNNLTIADISIVVSVSNAVS